ncbi:MAG: dTMP kinase [Proteobacteria bacterium]|nr:dTMP kinase [Pseudomonadota bacterium]
MSQRGAFITLEGLEGAGKSTGLETVKAMLDELGVGYLSTREPGGTALGERVRELLLTTDMAPMTELLLMFAARVEHVSSVIQPALNRGTWVVCDRFTDSSYAYQGGGRALGTETVADLEALTLPDLTPDLTLILDIDPKRGLDRATRDRKADRFESEQQSFFERTRAVFLRRASQDSRFHVIDAGAPVHEVGDAIRSALSQFVSRFEVAS